MKLKMFKKDSQLNKGFSLVELIVSMALLVIVGAAIIAFFSMSMTQYKSNTDETSLQTESQLAWKRLESNILMTTDGVWTPTVNEIDLYSSDGTYDKVMTAIYYDPSSEHNTIYYREFYLDGNEWKPIGDPQDPQVFSNLVKSFTVELYDKDNNKIEDANLAIRPVKVKAHIEYEANGRTYTSDNTVAIRNVIVASDDPTTIYTER